MDDLERIIRIIMRINDNTLLKGEYVLIHNVIKILSFQDDTVNIFIMALCNNSCNTDYFYLIPSLMEGIHRKNEVT